MGKALQILNMLYYSFPLVIDKEENTTHAHDVWFLLNGTDVTFEVQPKGHLKSISLCFWISVNNTLPMDLTLTIIRNVGWPWNTLIALKRTYVGLLI